MPSKPSQNSLSEMENAHSEMHKLAGQILEHVKDNSGIEAKTRNSVISQMADVLNSFTKAKAANNENQSDLQSTIAKKLTEEITSPTKLYLLNLDIIKKTSSPKSKSFSKKESKQSGEAIFDKEVFRTLLDVAFDNISKKQTQTSNIEQTNRKISVLESRSESSHFPDSQAQEAFLSSLQREITQNFGEVSSEVFLISILKIMFDDIQSKPKPDPSFDISEQFATEIYNIRKVIEKVSSEGQEVDFEKEIPTIRQVFGTGNISVNMCLEHFAKEHQNILQEALYPNTYEISKTPDSYSDRENEGWVEKHQRRKSESILRAPDEDWSAYVTRTPEKRPSIDSTSEKVFSAELPSPKSGNSITR